MDTLLSKKILFFKRKGLPTAYVIVEVVNVQKLMMELQQLESRYQHLNEDWEKLGFKIIEYELLAEVIKNLTEQETQALLWVSF